MLNFPKLTGERFYRYAIMISFRAGAGLLGAFVWRFPVPEKTRGGI